MGPNRQGNCEDCLLSDLGSPVCDRTDLIECFVALKSELAETRERIKNMVPECENLRQTIREWWDKANDYEIKIEQIKKENVRLKTEINEVRELEVVSPNNNDLLEGYHYRIHCDDPKCSESERVKSMDVHDMPIGWIKNDVKPIGLKQNPYKSLTYCPKHKKKYNISV